MRILRGLAVFKMYVILIYTSTLTRIHVSKPDYLLVIQLRGSRVAAFAD